MVTVSTSSANERVDMSDPYLVQFLHSLTAQPGLFAWTAPVGGPSGTLVQLYGSDFTYSGSGDARDVVSGTISGIEIDVAPDDVFASSELSIFNTSALVAANIDKDVPRTFWNEVLKGKDSFDLSGLDEDLVGLGPNVIFGDDLASATVIGNAISDSGLRDLIRGADNQFDLIGDVMTVLGDEGAGQFARYDGGRDRIGSGGGSDRQVRMSGDAARVDDFALLRGGDDKLAYANFAGQVLAAGDAFELIWGKINGGDDIITVDLALGAPVPHVAGDVLVFLGGQAVLNGGDDAIRIVGGGGFVGGDVYEFGSSLSGTINGGNDRLTGSAAVDLLVGDVFERGSFSVAVVGGADLIDGGAGDDLLLGDTGSGFSVGFETALNGGDDTILGGRGNDDIFGQTGDDSLFGDDGKDEISGGSGDDYAEGGESADAFFGGLGSDTMDGGAGKDRFDYFETSGSGPANADRDRIKGFIHGEDRIDLFDIDAIQGAGAGNDAFTFIGGDPFIQAGQLRAVQNGADTWIEANAVGASGAEMRIVLVGVTATTITADDFVL